MEYVQTRWGISDKKLLGNSIQLSKGAVLNYWAK